MPTYDYECPSGHRFELFQKMSDEPVAACPECGKDAKRQISGGAGFLFKGEGFYITDYRSEEYRKKASAETGEGGKSGAGPDKGSAGSGSDDAAGTGSSDARSGSGGSDSGGASGSGSDGTGSGGGSPAAGSGGSTGDAGS